MSHSDNILFTQKIGYGFSLPSSISPSPSFYLSSLSFLYGSLLGCVTEVERVANWLEEVKRYLMLKLADKCKRQLIQNLTPIYTKSLVKEYSGT